jgi:shikimate kinase
MSANAARPLIVEFVGGVPGAGKTTIARSCEALATSLGYSVCRQGAVKRFARAMGKLRMAWAFVRAPLFCRTLYYSLASPPLLRRPDESFLAYRWRCTIEPRWYFVMLYEFTRRNSNSMVILDQGMSRKLNIIADERRAANVLRFVARSDVYFDRHYVFLDLPVEVSSDRAWRRALRRQSGQERGWIRDLFLDRTALYQSYVEKYQPFYERRYSLFERHGMKVLRLDGERSADDNARLIIDRIIQPYVTTGGARTSAPRAGDHA